MMLLLLGIALKSLLIVGLAFGLLQLMRKRSAAERSWIAHLGLLALVVTAFAPIVLPSWNIQTPALVGQIPAIAHVVISAEGTAPAKITVGAMAAPSPARLTTVALSLYAIPAALLLIITLLSLGRLITLRARAEVLVDGHWLGALARAQRRMGFKHGTALLTSNDLASPISWGLVRPVILLSRGAVEATGDAEAVIAHELAHVAGLDWAKLLLARLVTALFWFNPLAWMLAREAHQLREEAADDAVLATNIPHTDYAELLVQVARHECRGLLLGAHGVAPSKNSLARRIARILDGNAARDPVAHTFGAAVLAGATLIVAPLAVLTLTPATAAKTAVTAQPIVALSIQEVADMERETKYFRSLLTGGSAMPPAGTIVSRAPNGATTFLYPTNSNGRRKEVSFAPNGAMTILFPADASGKRKVVSRAPNGATTITYEADRSGHRASGPR